MRANQKGIEGKSEEVRLVRRRNQRWQIFHDIPM